MYIKIVFEKKGSPRPILQLWGPPCAVKLNQLQVYRTCKILTSGWKIQDLSIYMAERTLSLFWEDLICPPQTNWCLLRAQCWPMLCAGKKTTCTQFVVYCFLSNTWKKGICDKRREKTKPLNHLLFITYHYFFQPPQPVVFIVLGILGLLHLIMATRSAGISRVCSRPGGS